MNFIWSGAVGIWKWILYIWYVCTRYVCTRLYVDRRFLEMCFHAANKTHLYIQIHQLSKQDQHLLRTLPIISRVNNSQEESANRKKQKSWYCWIGFQQESLWSPLRWPFHAWIRVNQSLNLFTSLKKSADQRPDQSWNKDVRWGRAVRGHKERWTKVLGHLLGHDIYSVKSKKRNKHKHV